MREWQPLHTAFQLDAQELTATMFPGVEVRSQRAANIPTAADPLGAQPSLVAEYIPARELFAEPAGRLKVFGDDSMPFLEPEAAAAYLVVQWPELFRRRQ